MLLPFAAHASRWVAEMAHLYNKNCLEVMREMQDKSVDGIVTDPPYMNYQTGWYDASEWHKPIDYLEPSQYASEFFRILKDDSAMVVFCRWDNFEIHAQAFRDVGFDVKNCIVWDKGNHTAGDLEGNLGFQYEQAVFAVKGNWKRHTKRETNLWRIPHLFSREKRDHPTEKPVPLMGRAVNLICASGIILDPFMGVGTTGKACVQMGYEFIGCEIVPEYFAIAEKNIKQAALQAGFPARNPTKRAADVGDSPRQQTFITPEANPLAEGKASPAPRG